MGQRLVVEIRKTDKETGGFRSLAVAYYHWSAYTEDSIDLTLFLIDKYNELREKYTDDLELAVRMLEASGAGLYPEEKFFIEQANMQLNFDIQDCENRNKGLLSVTERGINGLRHWEEGRVVIDIGTQEIDFQVYYKYSEQEFHDEWQFDSAVSTVTEEYIYNKLEVIPFDMGRPFKFDDFYELKEVFEKTKYQHGYRMPDSGDVIEWIR